MGSEAPDILTFARRLQLVGLSKAGLARTLGLDRATISRWGETPPRYALAYLELLERLRVRDP